MIALQILAFFAGLGLILSALFSAIRTFLVPRGVSDRLTGFVFVSMRYIFGFISWLLPSGSREWLLSYFAPVTLLTLPVVWLACLLAGYTGLYWGMGAHSVSQALSDSRLSLFALASNLHGLPGGTVFAFSETALSVLLAAVLVAYLPTIYSAFSQRETAVTGLETRAGSPATALAMLIRYHAIEGLDQIGEIWTTWQLWFETVEETHIALQPLVLYRSPQPGRSWITAAGCVLDTASIVASTLERRRDPGAELCVRAGYICLQRIAAVFGIPFNDDPAPTDPISVTRAEYDRLCDDLLEAGVPIKSDRDQCWRDFAGWRVNYDIALVALSVFVSAPQAPWSSDRVPSSRRLPMRADKRAREIARQMMEGRRQ